MHTATPPAIDVSPLPLAVSSVDEFIGKWWVAQTRPQHEKMLARDLNRRGVGYYLPLVQIECTRRRQGKRRACVPLFPMYVFINGDADARYEATQSDYTTQVIDVHKTQQALLTKELANLERAIEIEPCARSFSEFAVGDKCVVRSGHPMQGTEGVLMRRDDHRSVFVLRITMLGQSVPFEIAPEMLERL